MSKSAVSAENKIVDDLKLHEPEMSEPKASKRKALGHQEAVSKPVETERITSEKLRLAGDTLLTKVKALLKQGNLCCIKIQNKEGHTLVTIPLNTGSPSDGDAIADLPEITSVGIVGEIVACPTMVIEWQATCPLSCSLQRLSS